MDDHGAGDAPKHVHDFVQRSEPAAPIDGFVPPPRFDTEPEVPELRDPRGWYLLFSLLLLMLFVNLASYLKRDQSLDALPGLVDRLESTVRADVLTNSATKSASPGSQKEFQKIAEDVKKIRPAKVDTEILYAAALFEATKKPLTPKDLPILAASKDPRERGYFETYASPKISRADAERISRAIGTEKFLRKLAVSHAYFRAGEPSPVAVVPPGTKQKYILGLGLTVLSLALGVVFLLAGFIWLNTSGYRAKGFPVGQLSGAMADALALRAAQMIGIFLVVPMIVQAAMLPIPPAVRQILGFLPYFGVLWAFGWIARQTISGREFSLVRLGFRSDMFGKHIAVGMAAALANWPIVACAMWLGQSIFSRLPTAEHPITVELAAGRNSVLVLVGLFIVASVCAPLIEETLFRGAIAPAMSQKYGSALRGILVSSFFFAAIHPTGIPAWPSLMAVGAMSAFLSYETGSLVPSIAMHASHNFMILCVTVLMGG